MTPSQTLPDVPPVSGTAAQDRLLMLRETVAAARPETPAGDEALWALADLLEPLDPAVTAWDVDVIDAAVLVFGEAGLGPIDRQVTWLRWAQRAAAGLLGPDHPRTCGVNQWVTRVCYPLGRYGEAATAWHHLMRVHERAGQVDAAVDARINWAVCLYGQGRCGEAVTAVQQAWHRWKQDTEPLMAGARISAICMEMLRLCCRRNQAQAMWPDIAATIEPFFRYGGDLTELYTAGYRGPLSAREHGRVCAHRPASGHLPRHGEATR